MPNLSDFTIAELKAEIRRRESLLRRNFVRQTKTYKKAVVQAKNLSIKIKRLANNYIEDKDFKEKTLKTINQAYHNIFTNAKKLTGTQIKKGLKVIEKDINTFDKKWKKHYEKASNAIEWLYGKEKAKKYKKYLRTEVYKNSKLKYLSQIGKLKTIDVNTNKEYGRLFDFVIKDTHPSDTEEFIQKLIKGGYNEQEIRKLKEEYQKTGEVETPNKINYQMVFEKALREGVYDTDSEHSNIYLGKKLDTNTFLDIAEDEEFLL